MISKIKAVRKAGRVTRYHTHQLIHQEDVAQHTFNMMNLLMVLTHGNISHNLLLAALLHDQGEYITGDIPSPVKRGFDDATKHRIDGMESSGVDFIHHRGSPDLTEWEHKLLKLADNLDGYLKCCEEIKRGNDGLMDCRSTYRSYLRLQIEEIGGNIGSAVDTILMEYMQ